MKEQVRIYTQPVYAKIPECWKPKISVEIPRKRTFLQWLFNHHIVEEKYVWDRKYGDYPPLICKNIPKDPRWIKQDAAS